MDDPIPAIRDLDKITERKCTRKIGTLAAITIDGDTTEIDLAGVAPSHRGRGVYQQLLDKFARIGQSARCERMRISTQLSNLPPIRAWTRRGWLPEDIVETVHLIRRTPTWDEHRS